MSNAIIINILLVSLGAGLISSGIYGLIKYLRTKDSHFLGFDLTNTFLGMIVTLAGLHI